MSDNISEEVLIFESHFNALMKLEKMPNFPDRERYFKGTASALSEFDQRKAFGSEKDLFYFFEVVCFPYKNEIEYDKVEDWVSFLLNHTLKRLIVDKAENTKLLTAVRLFYILWLGIQKNAFEEDFLLEHFLDIYEQFEVPYEIRIIPYSFLANHYPVFAEEDTKNGLKLGLTVQYPKLAEAIFDI